MTFPKLELNGVVRNQRARAHAHAAGRVHFSNGTVPMRTVDDVPRPLAPAPELVERVFRSALCTLQAAHTILATARPDLRRARLEVFAASGKLVAWFAVTDPERCSLEFRDPVTDKAIVFPAPLTGPGTKPPSDNPMLRSDPKIPAPTATQLAEIAELVGQLAFTDGQLAAVLHRCKVQGGIEAIPDYFTAQHVLGCLEAMRRNQSRGSTAPTSLQRAKIAELVGRLALTEGQVAALLRGYKVRGGVAAISDYATAQKVRGALKAMCRSRGITAPTALQRAKIVELVRQVGLSDGQFAEALRGCGVRGGAEGILDYATAQHVLASLRAMRRVRGKDGRVDPLYHEAVDLVLESGKGSRSELQRRLRVGSVRASRLIDGMTAAGILGPARGDAARKVLIGLKET